MHNKTDVRRQLIATRAAIEDVRRLEWDEAISRHVHALLLREAFRSLGVYWPIRSEPDLRPLYHDLARHGVTLALPKVKSREAPLAFIPWTPGEPLVKDAYGTWVPDGHNMPKLPDALLIPCVGFSRQKMRLGYGAGFYDRTLAAMPRPFTIGIAYACTQAEFDTAEHDIALDIIITEQSIV
jgi:5,10-methenyltetrahydrofolate synthetase